MAIFRTHRRKALWVGALLMALLVIGCAGIEPYEPRNNREEGPQNGLFTGSEGEFIIFRKANEPMAGSEAGKSSDETSSDEKQKMGNEEKKTRIKSDAQQPSEIDFRSSKMMTIMIEFMLSLPTWAGCALAMVFNAVVSLVAYRVSHKLISKHQSDSMTEPTSSMFRVGGMLV